MGYIMATLTIGVLFKILQLPGSVSMIGIGLFGLFVLTTTLLYKYFRSGRQKFISAY
jgi:uncharacterized membrane protein